MLDISQFILISGGQTGVDRGALDAAIDLNFPCGGWCPEGREAEDGVIDERYPLSVLPGSGYRQRTIANVRDTDGTLILYFQEIRTGTELTLFQCIKLHKPYMLIDFALVTAGAAAPQISIWVKKHGVRVLNVAGPRESSTPGASRFAYETISLCLKLLQI